MANDIKVKICGLTTVADVENTARAGAAYIGLNFFPKSPRFVSLDKARDLALAAPVGLAKVALTVNADNATLDKIVDRMPLDILQLHGSESADRVAELRTRYGLPVMKAIGIGDESDLPKIEEFGRVADQLLIDAKPPKDAVLPGGNGLAFDWKLVKRKYWPCPWMLAGGLTPANVALAVEMTGARQVDVSSGVESAPGHKDSGMIRDFVVAAQG